MDREIVAAFSLVAISYYNYLSIYRRNRISKPWRRRRCWMAAMHRNRTSSTMENQLAELVAEPSGQFEQFTMSLTDFEYLVQRVSPLISKMDTPKREAIPAKIRLAITLRYLASGDTFESLHVLFKVSSSIISRIIPEVCIALNEVLKDQIRIPQDPRSWLELEKGFQKFPRCAGAIGGKHIVMQTPVHGGWEYYNDKGNFSVLLLALVDADYNFIFAEVGSQDRIRDDGLFPSSLLWQRICTNNLNLPTPRPLPGGTNKVPYVFLGDDGFELTPYVMLPYPGSHDARTPKHIFNKRLSSSRVVIENVFGILALRFRIFRKPLRLTPDKTAIVTMTCVLLHNFLRKSNTSSPIYTPPDTIDVYDTNDELVRPGSWRDQIDDTCAIRSLRQVERESTLNGNLIRDEFASYFFNCYNDG